MPYAATDSANTRHVFFCVLLRFLILLQEQCKMHYKRTYTNAFRQEIGRKLVEHPESDAMEIAFDAVEFSADPVSGAMTVKFFRGNDSLLEFAANTGGYQTNLMLRSGISGTLATDFKFPL